PLLPSMRSAVRVAHLDLGYAGVRHTSTKLNGSLRQLRAKKKGRASRAALRRQPPNSRACARPPASESERLRIAQVVEATDIESAVVVEAGIRLRIEDGTRVIEHVVGADGDRSLPRCRPAHLKIVERIRAGAVQR